MRTPPLPQSARHSQDNLKDNVRNSNIELLRIVAMFLIVLEHLLINGTSYFTAPVGNQAYTANFIIGFTYVGVNCFLLITGWFGIDLKWRKLFNIYFVCAFYELVFFIIYLILGKAEPTLSNIANIIFPLSHSSTWFIRCYTILLLAAPLINKGLEQLDKKQYQYILLLFTIINIYFGWFWKYPQFNSDGFNIQQFVYLYIIGGYLRRYIDMDKIVSHRWLWLTMYIALAVLWGIVQNIHNFIHIVPHWNGWGYCSPVIVTQAVCLLLFFSTIRVQSRFINVFASGTMAVFIVHMNRYFGDFLYDVCHEMVDMIGNERIYLQVTSVVSLTLLIQTGITLADYPQRKIRQWLLKQDYPLFR